MAISKKRSFKRYIAKEHAFALLKPYCDKLGQIKDISRDGIAFEYLVFNSPPESLHLSEQLQLDIILNPEALYMSQIPCKLIYDTPVKEENPLVVQGIENRRCGLKFGKLSEDQASTLEVFLEKHVLQPGKEMTGPGM